MSYDIDSELPVRAASAMSSPHSDPPRSAPADPRSLPNPFSNAMNHVFFSGADRRILLDEVVHLCQFGNNLVAVIGDTGVGKTTFLSQARYELAETAFCCLINGSEDMTPEDIFAQIISQLELPVSPTSSAGEMIAMLRHSMSEGKMYRVVVIVDNAHALSDGILSALISLLQGHQGQHLHILMGGEKSLVNRLDRFEMVDVLVYDVTVNPFSAQETKAYLDFKLNSAGYSEDYLLSDEEAETIWQESGGYPAQIDTIAERYLFNQDLGIDNESDTRSGLPLTHMALLVVLLAALILALLYIGDDGDGKAASGKSVSKEEQITLPIQDQKPTIPIQSEKPVSPVESASPDVSTIEVDKQPSVGEPPQAASTPVQPVLVESEPATASSEKAPVSEPVVQAPLEPEKSIKAPTVKNEPAPPKQEQQKPLQPALKQELQQEAKSLNTGSQKQSPAKSSSSALSTGEAWLMALDDDSYVLQVIAGGQKQGVEKFISAQPNKEDLHFLTVERAGQPWYIVVTGNFSGVSEARRAIQSLPQSQVNGGPWPRNVSDLKNNIAAFKRK